MEEAYPARLHFDRSTSLGFHALRHFLSETNAFQGHSRLTGDGIERDVAGPVENAIERCC